MTESEKKPAKPPKLYYVPAGTKPSTCKGHTLKDGKCRAAVFWIEYDQTDAKAGRATGKKVRRPVDCAPNGQVETWAPSKEGDTTQREGRGVSHYTTCPDAGKF